MKKLFALCLAAVVALGLAACGGSTSSSAAASEPGTSDAASSAAASVAAAGKDPANCKIDHAGGTGAHERGNTAF